MIMTTTKVSVGDKIGAKLPPVLSSHVLSLSLRPPSMKEPSFLSLRHQTRREQYLALGFNFEGLQSAGRAIAEGVGVGGPSWRPISGTIANFTPKSNTCIETVATLRSIFLIDEDKYLAFTVNTL